VQHLAVPILTEVDGAHGVGAGGPAAERHLGVGRNDGEVEADRRRRGGGGLGVGRVGGLGALCDEEHARDGDGDMLSCGAPLMPVGRVLLQPLEVPHEPLPRWR
jgi:hypothetical protein